MNILDAVKGISGNYEINRLIGAIGSIIYVIGANAFTAYEVVWKANAFDITAYCLAFPGGLAVAVGATAGAVAIKDRAVASATVTRDTGKIPAAPPAGPSVSEGEVQQTAPQPTDGTEIME